jgi:hypothetical protein
VTIVELDWDIVASPKSASVYVKLYRFSAAIVFGNIELEGLAENLDFF